MASTNMQQFSYISAHSCVPFLSSICLFFTPSFTVIVLKCISAGKMLGWVGSLFHKGWRERDPYIHATDYRKTGKKVCVCVHVACDQYARTNVSQHAYSKITAHTVFCTKKYQAHFIKCNMTLKHLSFQYISVTRQELSGALVFRAHFAVKGISTSC